MLFQCHKESHAGNLRVLQKRKEKKRKEKKKKKRKEKKRKEKRREEKRRESEVMTEGADVNDL